MLNFNRNRQINPKISKYIKEQTNKSIEKYKQSILEVNNIKAYHLFYTNTI
jgi:hypothetical protein